MTRTLGRSGIEVGAIGVGCWAIGGPLQAGTDQFGFSQADDDESIATLRRAHELGATFFDTSSNYGAGHSEQVLGRAFAGRRDEVVIATKWGYTFDETTREAGPDDASAAFLRSSLEDSLRRLGTDYVDLFQFHLGGAEIPAALELIPVLDELVAAGKIRSYGWSTDDPERAEAFAKAGAGCTAIQHDHSVLNDAAGVLAVCEALDQASIARGPLAMGLLSGKYHDGRHVGGQDVRAGGYDWMTYFTDGTGNPEFLARIDSVREVLTSGGRTLAQGALAWLLARSPAMIPIPGCRTVAQAEENLGALALGPLSEDEFRQVESILRG
ncbi:aldo/keto reductase [Streptomyces aidingensis]|uniref:Predicted oxidoreductase n=1 Tax=Streptomyces aidingensis TaxID=910347 RepID=A0A1I1RHC3_9ACTN|nr:aldo/keto reductase [Streptomyces aidingensis]SFD31618.1 Predicted oxidoreductase [Streptomyces aidingensis]